MTNSAEEEAPWNALLRQIIELSGEGMGLRDTLRRVAEFVVEATRADACFVHVVDHDDRQLVLMGATPEKFHALAGTIRLSIGEGLAGWVAEQARPALVDDKWSDPRYVYIPALQGESFSSMVSVPMLRQPGMVIGVLNVHATAAHHFTTEDLPRLGEVARLLAGIVENAVLYDRLAQREAELAQFASRTIELQESDRRRIAGEIHDGISQRLISAYYRLRAARPRVEGPAALEDLDAAEALVTEALDEARRAILGLRPTVLDDLGLGPALASLAANLGGDIEIDLEIEPVELPNHIETTLFRIAQEALQNVVKHAQAHQVGIRLGPWAEGVVLAVTDDGRGFDTSQERDSMTQGLRGLQERATLIGAELEVKSREGAGTSVVVSLADLTSA